MKKHMIAWDLGATNCTAGLVEYDTESADYTCHKSVTHRLTDARDLGDLINLFESGLQTTMAQAEAICIGGAGQYDGHTLQLENGYPYTMNIAHHAQKNNWPTFNVVHDYTPVICSTFTSHVQHPENVKMLSQGQPNVYGRRVAFGIGTGLGLKDGVLLENGDFWIGHNEAGHIGIVNPPAASAAQRARHTELVKHIEALEGHQAVTFEKILSGKGLVRLYHFLYPTNPIPTPEEVDAQMRHGHTPELKELLAWYIGLFIGTVQVTFMPQGGIWIGGGVSLRHLDLFDLPAFQAGIHATPAYRSLREQYPLGVLLNHEHTLIGCGFYAANRIENSRACA